MTGFAVQGLDHVALSVSDLEQSVHWYQEVLGLERVHADRWQGVPAMLMRGGSGVALFPTRGDENGRPAIRVLHVAFRVDRASFDTAQRALGDRGIAVEFQDHGVCHSIYFRDPDGHHLELTTYEL